MQLEFVEELCIGFLEQTTNPLTPLETLYNYCKRNDTCSNLTQFELYTFLRNHERIMMLLGPDQNEPVNEEALRAGGLLMGPRVILKERIPSEGNLMLLFKAQLDDMETKLKSAIDSLNSEQQEEIDAFTSALKRIKILRDNIQKLDRR